MEDKKKKDELIALKAQAQADIKRVKKLLKGNPDDKGLSTCLNQAISTNHACAVFIRIISEVEDDVCWGLNCTYYDNNDHFIKSDGSINKWCLGCCQAGAKEAQDDT
jgi:hypothetical protein